MQGTHDNVGTFTASGAIARNVRVMSPAAGSGAPAQVSEAANNEIAIGVSEHAAADGELVAVRLYGAGTMQMTAAVAIAQGDVVHGAAAGKITDVGGVGIVVVGVALEASAADGDIIHVAPYGREVPA